MSQQQVKFSVLISANAEWDAVKTMFPGAAMANSPYGEYFFAGVDRERLVFFQGGWGKVAAAASAQYAIDRFRAQHIINLGTCGGVESRVRRFDIVAAERVVIYDIHEAMGDNPSDGISHYTTDIDLPEAFPMPVIRTTMYSADRDVTSEVLRDLERRFRPAAVDWESGSIAWVAKRNGIPVLILRGVSDLISLERAEAHGDEALWEHNATAIMRELVGHLPDVMALL